MKDKLRDMGARVTSTQIFWFVTAGVALATFWAGTTMVQTPWQERRRQLAARSAEEQQRNELLIAVRKQTAAIRQQEQGKLLEGGSSALTNQVSRVAKENGVEIESVAPQAETVLAPYTKHQIEVVFLATLRDLTRFLHALERHKYLVSIDEVEAENAGNFDPQQPAPDTLRRVRVLVSGYTRKGRNL